MTSSNDLKSATSNSSMPSAFHIFSHVRKIIRDYLQRQYKIQEANKAYSLLLESNDYLLRDIGVNRADIRRRKDRLK